MVDQAPPHYTSASAKKGPRVQLFLSHHLTCSSLPPSEHSSDEALLHLSLPFCEESRKQRTEVLARRSSSSRTDRGTSIPIIEERRVTTVDGALSVRARRSHMHVYAVVREPAGESETTCRVFARQSLVKPPITPGGHRRWRPSAPSQSFTRSCLLVRGTSATRLEFRRSSPRLPLRPEPGSVLARDVTVAWSSPTRPSDQVKQSSRRTPPRRLPRRGLRLRPPPLGEPRLPSRHCMRASPTEPRSLRRILQRRPPSSSSFDHRRYERH
nr:uncharacterized protein LOC127338571 [Lolium perenne]